MDHKVGPDLLASGPGAALVMMLIIRVACSALGVSICH